MANDVACSCTGGDVKLLGAKPSPFVLRARVALNLKGVEYKFLEEKFEAKSELLLKSNPVHKKMPVLLHNGKPICESLVIVQYIDEAFASSGPSILPSDPYDRAVARFWAAYVDEKWLPTLRAIDGAQDEESKKTAIDQLKQGLVILEEEAFNKCSKGKPYFSGEEEIGFVDIAVGCYVGWVKVSEKINGIKMLDGATVPGLAGWAERFLAHPCVKSVTLETDELVELVKVMKDKLSASRLIIDIGGWRKSVTTM